MKIFQFAVPVGDNAEDSGEWRACIARYRHVQNLDDLRADMKNTEHPFDYAVINGEQIADEYLLKLACYRAACHAQSEQQQQQRTRTLHSEILYCLSPSTNISDSLRVYGIPANTSKADDIYLVHLSRVEMDERRVREHWQSLVDGHDDTLDDGDAPDCRRWSPAIGQQLNAMAIKGL